MSLQRDTPLPATPDLPRVAAGKLVRNVDVIVLSYAKDDASRQMTVDAINSLIASEPDASINFVILIVESNKELAPYQYPRSTTIYPSAPFGYHRFLNIGIKHTASSYVCMCNNDLVFHPYWATTILREMDLDPTLVSASPRCSIFHATRGIDLSKDIQVGYENGIHVTGWCIFVRRYLFEIIGPLDERFEFWHCDDDYRNTLKKHSIKHALIIGSVVDHLGSKTIDSSTVSPEDRWRFTTWQRLYYEFKWMHGSRLIYVLKAIKYLARRWLGR